VVLIDQLHSGYGAEGILTAVKALREEVGGTWLYATTSINETRGLADKIVQMGDGAIQWIMLV